VQKRKVVSRAASKVDKPPKAKKKRAPSKKTKRVVGVTTINAWETDPGNGNQPTGGTFVQRPVPVLSTAPLPTRIVNPAQAPAAGQFAPGTPGFRYWTAAEALRRSSDYWGALLPGVSWQVGASLPVGLDEGERLNAFYDRVGLSFFHADVGGRTVYSGESADVVCHELGHALLDSIKPQLWDAASLEIAAFHEAFGDITAILAALQLPTLRHAVLLETGGALYRTSRLTRVAEQLGWAIRQSRPSSVDADCLRNAVNSFFYREPNTLPTNAPATSLSSEPHSFSRVFTGAFFEGLAGMLNVRPAQDEPNLLQVSQDMGRLLADAIRAASVVPTFFSQVAANVLRIATQRFAAQGYEQPLRSAFVRHGVLPPGPAFAVAATQPMPMTAAAAEPTTLQQVRLSVAEYGLGVPSVLVYAASEPKTFDVAGAAMAIGAAVAPAQDEAAKAFLEDLLRRGRLKVATPAGRRAEIVRPTAVSGPESHTHEIMREGADAVLRRVRVDCNCFLMPQSHINGERYGEGGRKEAQGGTC